MNRKNLITRVTCFMCGTLQLFSLLLHARAGMKNHEVLVQLEKGGFRHPCPAKCPPKLYEVMLQCWKQEAADRPTFDHLYHTMDDFAVATQNGYAESGGQ